METQDDERFIATWTLKRIVAIATGTEPPFNRFSDAQRFRAIADTAQMHLDMWLEPVEDPKWRKPTDGPGRPLCPNGHGEMVPQFGGYVYLCPQCGATIEASGDQVDKDAGN